MAKAAALILSLTLVGSAGAHEWTGPYGGFSAGVLGGGYSDDAGMSFSNLGASAGLFGGFRAPVGQALAGVELAGQVSAVKAEGMQGFGLPDGNFGSVGKVGARATLGLPVDRYLPYVAIGAALSFQHYTPFAGRNTAVAHPSLEAAIGLDYAFTDKMFGRLEASYTGLSSENYNIGLGQWRVSPHGVVEVRAGVGLSFN